MNAFLKRCFDLIVSAMGLVIVSPFFLVLVVLIWLEDGAPVFFRQVRVGKNGRPFRIWKFRTMYKDAESRGPQVTVGVDPRITKTGSWIRRYKFDELAQLINVCSGEMSFVGPRPEVPKYVAFYNEEQKKVLLAKPGITDPASISYRDEASLLEKCENPEKVYIEEIMPKKLQLNLEYIRDMSFLNDLKLIFKTVWLVFIART